jgi:peptidoglycan/LPS O-acetylase OafA/YrhL
MLVNIQWLRFVAAFAVVLYHAAPLWPDAPGWVAAAGAVGFAGVDVFFVISGFIVWYTTQGASGSEPAMAFLKRRFARIYAGYWPYLGLTMLLLWWFDPARWAGCDLLGSLFLLPIPIASRVLPVSWTLTYELYFYLLFFSLLWLPERIRRRVLILLGAMVLAAMMIGIAMSSLGLGFATGLPRGLRPLLSPYLLEFLAGTFIGRLHGLGVRRGSGAAMTTGVLLFTVGGWYNLEFPGSLEGGLHVIERVACFGPAAALLVYAALSLEAQGHSLGSAPGELLGGASYSLYLAHTPLIGLFGWLGLGALFPTVGVTPVLLGWLGVILLYSVWQYQQVEAPCYRWARGWLRV